MLLINFSILEGELNKAFFNMDFYSQDYAERISDLYQLVFLSQQLLDLFEFKRDQSNLSK